MTLVVTNFASLLPPCGGNAFRFVAPPLQFKPISLGFELVYRGTARVVAAATWEHLFLIGIAY